MKTSLPGGSPRLAVSLTVALAVTLAVAGAACSGEATPGTQPLSDAAVAADAGAQDDTSPAAPDAGPGSDSAAGPDAVALPVIPGTRAPRRMTVAQLAASIPVVTGGIEWVEDFGQGPTDLLQVLAGTLGAPDYVNVTEENLEPSIIIAKFMNDAAQRVCPTWIARDRALPREQRTLVSQGSWDSVAEADVKANLRALQLRFYSRYVPADGPDGDAPIADLYDLFVAASSGAAAGQASEDGWYAVCFAMMTAPEFVIY